MKFPQGKMPPLLGPPASDSEPEGRGMVGHLHASAPPPQLLPMPRVSGNGFCLSGRWLRGREVKKERAQ